MRCGKCGFDNPDDHKFCGQCGGSLSRTDERQHRAEEKKELDGIFGDDFTPKTFIEMRLAEAVVDRIIGWFKTLAYIVGIPVAVAATIFGITTVPNLIFISNTAQKAHDDIVAFNGRVENDNKALDAAETNAGKIGRIAVNATGNNDQMNKLNADLDLVNQKISALQAGLLRQAVRIADPTPASTARLAAGSAGRLVFIQYADSTSRGALEDLRSALAANGFVTPGLQALGARFFEGDEIKYFHDEDRGLAQRIADIANARLALDCDNHPTITVPRSKAFSHNPDATTQLEIWLKTGCTKPSQTRPSGAPAWDLTLSSTDMVDIAGNLPKGDQNFVGCVVEGRPSGVKVKFGYVHDVGGNRQLQSLVVGENGKACVAFSFNGEVADLGAQLLDPSPSATAHIQVWPGR